MTGSIYSRRNIRVLGGFVVLASLILAYVMYRPAVATHTPADKVVGGSGKIDQVPPAPTTGAGTVANNIIGPVKLRSSKPSDLILSVTLECSILTEVTSTTALPSAAAEGLLRVWVVVDGTTIVPISTPSSSPPQNPPAAGDDTDKVTFCNREHQLQQTDAEGETGQVDTTRSFIETKEANAFNWIRLNMGNGTHTIEVRADLLTSTTNTATASGFVGNRTLVVEPAKLANDASI